MSKLKVTFFGILLIIAVVAYVKWPSRAKAPEVAPPQHEEIQEVIPSYQQLTVEEVPDVPAVTEVREVTPREVVDLLTPLSDDSAVPKSIDRMPMLFNTFPPLLPIVDTVTYTTKVPWIQGRAAYLGDYASYFKTSKHFISRSLHGDGEFMEDKVAKGDRFNVIRTDRDIEFHLVVDLSRLKMWVYSYDATENARVLLKDYRVAAGKRCANSPSGSLTPTGVFALGEEIAVYNENSTGYRHGRKIDMISVFGKRWIPLMREIADCSGPCKGLGIHGMPCRPKPPSDQWVECCDSIGTYASDGCIRMVNDDICELFSVIVSRPTYLHVVRDFTQAKLPGVEQF